MVAPNDGPYGEDKIQHDTTIHRLGTGSFFSAFFTERTSSTNILPPLFFFIPPFELPPQVVFLHPGLAFACGPHALSGSKGGG
ncbi:hypothetical protein POX_d05565 [Penicillium oxalicum]|uniref:hypothetical protein n=1 Tax=Penicillium oxalicum TaxID=69781 RepID=UPI0020B6F50B|nr:hypothetical protein POX_d05565 [Penicillium oxalicum]KAI2790061.1 hypothetical protein POX_d05565 [Penicillium oxalicum]